MSETIPWLDWTDSAFARAEAENTPILLSLVTAWSEECRAMDRTTFAHPEVIAALSSKFVTVRVDADRRPDVNERYNLGGWPTTVFLTAEGGLLSGGTYLNPEQMLSLSQQVTHAWHERGAELRTRGTRQPAPTQPRNAAGPDTDAVAHMRSLIVQRFDRVNGGFDRAPKLPHVVPLLFALSLASEEEADAPGELAEIIETTLERIISLWDRDRGGFFRYADGADWSRPGVEKTLDDNAALLHLFIEAAIRRNSDDYRGRAADLVRWVKSDIADGNDGGFSNAQSGALVDRAMYVDRNSKMVSAFLRAAALFEDPWLRDLAVKSFEAVVVPGYTPGNGVAHAPGIRGLLADQVHVADAAIWAYAVTEQLPYPMLAVELMQFAIRAMWDDTAQAFRDRLDTADALYPFQLNCEAACVLDRLATLTEDASYRERALAVLTTFADEYKRHHLFGAPYALAIREVIDRRPPAGLVLTKVDW